MASAPVVNQGIARLVTAGSTRLVNLPHCVSTMRMDWLNDGEMPSEGSEPDVERPEAISLTLTSFTHNLE